MAIYIALLSAQQFRSAQREQVGFDAREREGKTTREDAGADWRGKSIPQRGPLDAKDLDWAMVVLMQVAKRSRWSEERRRWNKVTERGQRMRSWWYFGARPSLALQVKNENFELYAISEREPVKFFNHECRDVGETWKMGYQSSSCIKYRLWSYDVSVLSNVYVISSYDLCRFCHYVLTCFQQSSPAGAGVLFTEEWFNAAHNLRRWQLSHWHWYRAAQYSLACNYWLFLSSIGRQF